MLPDKEDVNTNEDANKLSSAQDKQKDEYASAIPNPFEKHDQELSQETLDSIEQFKEAQTERD